MFNIAVLASSLTGNQWKSLDGNSLLIIDAEFLRFLKVSKLLEFKAITRSKSMKAISDMKSGWPGLNSEDS